MSEGVREIEHTADAGIEIEAGDLPSLFHRAAAGTMHVLGGRAGSAEPATDSRDSGRSGASGDSRVVRVALEAPAADILLARWLGELLFLRQTEGWEYRSTEFGVLEPRRLEAEVVLVSASGDPEREIKGVTYHGLQAEPRGEGWWARVIFDL
jgi:SHS2 domain-containing protein